MHEKTYFTVVVPLNQEAQRLISNRSAVLPLRTAVWTRAADRMKPLLGTKCSRYSPAMNPYGETMRLPLGVALGGLEPEQFLLCYFHAREAQELELEKRTQKIRACGKMVGQFQMNEEQMLTIMAFRSLDPNLQELLDTARRFFSNDITGAAGLYYLGFNANHINDQNEEKILKNPGAYAICVAELQPMEEAS